MTSWQYHRWGQRTQGEEKVWAQKNDDIGDLCESAVPRGHLSGSWKVKPGHMRDSCQDNKFKNVYELCLKLQEGVSLLREPEEVMETCLCPLPPL